MILTHDSDPTHLTTSGSMRRGVLMNIFEHVNIGIVRWPGGAGSVCLDATGGRAGLALCQDIFHIVCRIFNPGADLLFPSAVAGSALTVC